MHAGTGSYAHQASTALQKHALKERREGELQPRWVRAAESCLPRVWKEKGNPRAKLQLLICLLCTQK